MLFSNFCKISSASWGNLTFGTVTVDHIPAEATKLNVTLVEVTEGWIYGKFKFRKYFAEAPSSPLIKGWVKSSTPIDSLDVELTLFSGCFICVMWLINSATSVFAKLSSLLKKIVQKKSESDKKIWKWKRSSVPHKQGTLCFRQTLTSIDKLCWEKKWKWKWNVRSESDVKVMWLFNSVHKQGNLCFCKLSHL